MARRSGLDEVIGCFGCLFVVTVVVGGILAIPISFFGDGAEAPPEPEPGPPELREARLWITGDDGGTYEAEITLWTPDGDYHSREVVSGTIEPDATWWPIELDGFTSDGQEPGTISSSDIDIEVNKTGNWGGYVHGVLEINGKQVACGAQDDAGYTSYISFDADDPEAYERSNACGFTLQFK